jgi:AcrR family transcriptional regulator
VGAPPPLSQNRLLQLWNEAPVPNRRTVKEPSATRDLILNTVEKLMLDEGYGAVTARRVAAEAGVKHPLVHYYFPTTDDLFLALYRRTVEQVMKLLDEALASEQPLHSLWKFSADASHKSLAIEFMALANHRKIMRKEIACHHDRIREKHAAAFSTLADAKAIDPKFCTPLGLSVLLVAVARMLMLEQSVGISLGHADARMFVEHLLDQYEPAPRKKRVASTRHKSRS